MKIHILIQRIDTDMGHQGSQQDNSKQVAQIETAIKKRPDLLIVAPNERGPLTKIMGEAMAADIPIICLERDILEPNFTTYVRCDNLEIGRMAGQFILDHLQRRTRPGGRVEGPGPASGVRLRRRL